MQSMQSKIIHFFKSSNQFSCAIFGKNKIRKIFSGNLIFDWFIGKTTKDNGVNYDDDDGDKKRMKNKLANKMRSLCWSLDVQEIYLPMPEKLIILCNFNSSIHSFS